MQLNFKKRRRKNYHITLGCWKELNKLNFASKFLIGNRNVDHNCDNIEIIDKEKVNHNDNDNDSKQNQATKESGDVIINDVKENGIQGDNGINVKPLHVDEMSKESKIDGKKDKAEQTTIEASVDNNGGDWLLKLKTGDTFGCDLCSMIQSYFTSLDWRVTVVARIIVDGQKKYPIKHITYIN